MRQQSATDQPKATEPSATQVILHHGDELTFSYQGAPLYRMSVECLSPGHESARACEWRYHVEHVSGLSGRTALIHSGDVVSLAGGAELIERKADGMSVRFGLKSAHSLVVYLSRNIDAPFFAQLTRSGGQAMAKLH